MKTKLTFIEQEANYADSMRILKEHKLRPLTYQEALANSEELIKHFNGHWLWFWLAGKELRNDGIFTFTRSHSRKPITFSGWMNANAYETSLII